MNLPGLFLVLVATLHVLRLDGPWYCAVATMVIGVLLVGLQGEHGHDEQDAAEGGERPAGTQQ